ncbi:MAG: glycosyl hydrolase-related protein, partial [Promethearchaeota archaeon]
DIEMLEITWVEDTDSLENVSLDIAGIGHTTYYLRNILPENSEDNPMDNGKIKNNEEEIINKKYETKWATIQINENGSFDLIFKSTGKEFKNLHYFIDCADAGDGYDFYMPKNDSEINNLDLKAEIQAEENELSYIFKVDYTFPLPEALNKERTERLEKKIGLKIHSTITIWKEFSRIDFNTELFNNVRDHRLRVAFPTPIRTDHVNASSVYDVVERGIGIEEYINTMSKWSQKPEPTSFMNGFVDISDDYRDYNPKEGENKRTSMAIFSKGLNEYEARRIKDGAMRPGQEGESNNNHSENTENGSAVEMVLTLLRAVRYEGGYIPTRGHAGDPIPTPDAQLQRQLKFEYALYFHENDWEEDLIPLKSQEYILPISIIGGQVKIPGRRNVQEFPEYKKYKLPPHSNYLYIPNPNLILTAFKKGERPENGDYFVLRLYNPTRKEQESIIELNADLLRGVKKIGLLNLIEKEIPNNGELMVKKQEETIESIKVTIKPKKIITLGFFK